jgi:hypothetical protein
LARLIGAPHGAAQGVNTIFPRNPPRSRLMYAYRQSRVRYLFAYTRKLLDLFVEVDSQIKRRVSPFIARLGATLPNDTSQAAGRDARRDLFFGTVIDRLNQLAVLRLGLSRDRALDILRVVNSLEAYVELTERRGWSDDEWRVWLGRVLRAELLGATTS